MIKKLFLLALSIAPGMALATTNVTDFAVDVGDSAAQINTGIWLAAVAALVIFVALYGLGLMIRAFKKVK